MTSDTGGRFAAGSGTILGAVCGAGLAAGDCVGDSPASVRVSDLLCNWGLVHAS